MFEPRQLDIPKVQLFRPCTGKSHRPIPPISSNIDIFITSQTKSWFSIVVTLWILGFHMRGIEYYGGWGFFLHPVGHCFAVRQCIKPSPHLHQIFPIPRSWGNPSRIVDWYIPLCTCICVYTYMYVCVYIYMHIHVYIYNIPIMLGYCIPRNLPIESVILDSREAVIRSTRDAAGKRCAGIVWRETIKTCEDHPNHQWIGLMENLQENPIFNGKIYGFL